jgi:hypothetical protein
MATKRAGWGTAILVIVAVVFAIWGPQIMHKIDFGTPKATRRLIGDWVGPFTLAGTYKPEIYGVTPGPHTNGLLFIHSYRTSPNLDWIEANGEICLTGEPTTRPIKLTITKYNDDGSFSIEFYAEPTLGAFPWNGQVTASPGNDTLTLGNDIELAIHATLHRGTLADFRQRSTCAPPPEKN